MFITLEDETGIANLVVWPQLFERQRTLVLSAGLMGCRGRVQRQGRVVHLVAEELSDHSGWLSRIGELDVGRLPTGRGDEARHGGSPDQRTQPIRGAVADAVLGGRARDILVPDLHVDAMRAGAGASETDPAIQLRARNFR